jgi:hypothetical protein
MRLVYDRIENGSSDADVFHDMCYGLRVASYGLRVTGFGFRVASYVLRVTGFGLRVVSYGFRVASYELRVSGYELRVVSCSNQGTSCRILVTQLRFQRHFRIQQYQPSTLQRIVGVAYSHDLNGLISILIAVENRSHHKNHTPVWNTPNISITTPFIRNQTSHASRNTFSAYCTSQRVTRTS